MMWLATFLSAYLMCSLQLDSLAHSVPLGHGGALEDPATHRSARRGSDAHSDAAPSSGQQGVVEAKYGALF